MLTNVDLDVTAERISGRAPRFASPKHVGQRSSPSLRIGVEQAHERSPCGRRPAPTRCCAANADRLRTAPTAHNHALVRRPIGRHRPTRLADSTTADHRRGLAATAAQSTAEDSIGWFPWITESSPAATGVLPVMSPTFPSAGPVDETDPGTLGSVGGSSNVFVPGGVITAGCGDRKAKSGDDRRGEGLTHETRPSSGRRSSCRSASSRFEVGRTEVTVICLLRVTRERKVAEDSIAFEVISAAMTRDINCPRRSWLLDRAVASNRRWRCTRQESRRCGAATTYGPAHDPRQLGLLKCPTTLRGHRPTRRPPCGNFVHGGVHLHRERLSIRPPVLSRRYRQNGEASEAHDGARSPDALTNRPSAQGVEPVRA